MKLECELITARLRASLSSAHGEVEVRKLVLVRLVDEHSGLTGYGEAAPLPSYDGVSVEDVLAALADCRKVLEGLPGDLVREQLLARCTQAAVLPQAVAAVDLALWDLEGRRTGEPVWALLGAASAPPLAVNATIGAVDRAGAAAAAAEARAAGFPCVKVKVGLGDDAGRVAAVRAFGGPALAIRLDANGAWSIEQAVAALAALAPAGIELCEEPCHGLDELHMVAADSPVPVALDESARLPGALEDPVCPLACLKVAGCGGITGLLDAARRARASGYEVYLASTLDGPLGIAAALHAAAAISPERPCGLATLDAFDGRASPLEPVHGMLAAPLGRGLGDGLLSWYAAAE